MSAEGEIVGMVDVLKLTYATLDQINSMSTGDSEGPAWNKFWMSIGDDATESMLSGDGSHAMSRHHLDARSHVMSPDMSRPGMERLDSVAPGDSASHAGHESPSASAVGAALSADVPFPFKFKAPSGRVHRLAIAPASGLPTLVSIVAEKLGGEAAQLGGVPNIDGETFAMSSSGFALSYIDNEGDTVAITSDADIIDAIALARLARRDKVDLFVHHPEKPPLPTPVAALPVTAAIPTPPESVKDRNSYCLEADSEEEEVVTQKSGLKKRKGLGSVTPVGQSELGSKAEQLIQGVPNELLLPGAIMTLSVVIVGVFAFTRGSSK